MTDSLVRYTIQVINNFFIKNFKTLFLFLPPVCLFKSWTQRWKVSTFAMEVKRSFFEMKMEHTERSHASRAFEKP